MKRELKVTSDGSKTLYMENWDECYHSVHGALNESMHVFIKNGLNEFHSSSLNILEFGFGTGLNALLTLAERGGKLVNYTALEKFPLNETEWSSVAYGRTEAEQHSFAEIHRAKWNTPVEVEPGFVLKKMETGFEEVELDAQSFDLIYYDAFAPSAQPELWTIELFEKCYNALKPGGFLVTYCAKGQVKRNMKAAGFEVVALPGPPMKREMTKATRPLYG